MRTLRPPALALPALPALLALLALLAPAATARAAEPARAPAAAVKPAEARAAIPVGGMSCGGCVNTITGALQRIPGVRSVEVSLEKRRAYVGYDASQVSAKALVEAIREAGFEPGLPIVN